MTKAPSDAGLRLLAEYKAVEAECRRLGVRPVHQIAAYRPQTIVVGHPDAPWRRVGHVDPDGTVHCSIKVPELHPTPAAV
jgi:hypothetical protein